MATTIRTYRHSPDVSTDPTGTLVDTESAGDTSFSVSVATAGWPGGSYEITTTSQRTNEAESAHSNALAITVQSGFSIGSPTSNRYVGSANNPVSVTVDIPSGAVVVALVAHYGINQAIGTGGVSGSGTASGLGAFDQRATYEDSGGVEIYTKVNTGSTITGGTISFSVQTGATSGNNSLAIQVWVITGADTGQLTTTNTNGGSGALSVNIAAPGNNSYLFGVIYLPDVTPATSILGNTTEAQLYDDSLFDGGTAWFLRTTDVVVTSTSTTIGYSTTASSWSGAAIAIRSA